MADQEHNSESHAFHREGDAIVFDKPPSEAEASRQRRENEQHEFSREQVKTNKRIAWFSGLLVIGTFAGTGIGVWQASISRTAAHAAKDAADAAKSAANTAASQLELADRPWVSIKDARVISPLIFSARGAQITLEIVLHNSGNSPAVGVLVSPRLYVLAAQENEVPPLERLCNNKIPKNVHIPGLTLFPSTDSPAQKVNVTLSSEEIGRMKRNGIIVITPMICVAYRSTFNPDGAYSTGIQYSLWPTVWPDKMPTFPIQQLPLDRNVAFGEIAR